MLEDSSIEFSLADHPYIELNNLLKLTGLCSSGGEAKACIADGQVRVDGEVELRKRCKIRVGQTVNFNNETLLVKS